MNTPLDGTPLPLAHLSEYNAAADYFAKHDRLPACMGSPGAIDYINNDPEAFMRDVQASSYAYGNARA